jgi:uncharacterized membrane protein
MRALSMMMLALAVVSSCRPSADLPQNRTEAAPTVAAAPGWVMQKGSTDTALILNGKDGAPVISIICASPARLIVNVPAFRPVGSEDRLSFGAGGEVIALVADTGGDKQRGGVSGEGRIPDELKRLIIAPLSASYGPQTSGPHAPPADSIAGPFLNACSELLTVARVDATKPKPGTSPCLIQDGTLLRLAPMKAVGTEPFWGARTDGRCVTYSTPEDQAGTRIWTEVGSGPMGPVWVGSYQGKPFVLRMQPAVRCSDGMSDKVYDWEVVLTVAGEERKGCAERL